MLYFNLIISLNVLLKDDLKTNKVINANNVREERDSQERLPVVKNNLKYILILLY